MRELRLLQRDILGFLVHMERTYGNVSCLRVGPQLVCLVSDPALVQEILVTNHRAFRKTWLVPIARDVLGEGMLTSVGEFHQRQRKLIQPALHKQRVRAYAETMVRAAARTGDAWTDGGTVDMAQEMMRLALSIVVETLFGSSMGEGTGEVGRAITCLTEVFIRVRSPFAVVTQRLPFLPVNRRADEARRQLDATIFRLIAERRQSGARHDDLLQMLLDARDEEGGGGMTDRQVRDEAVALFLAGHETTSNVLTWTWCLLSQHPHAEAELHHELATVLGGRLPSAEDLERLPYLRKVVTEALRLYPPAYVLPRRVVESCTLGPFALPPGALVFLCTYLVHRDPRNYRDPEVFDPHRWTPELKQQLPRYAYFPFGGGPHSCMGEHFAWAEAMLVLAVLGQRWRARVAPGHAVGVNPVVNLRPRGGMPMVLAHRGAGVPAQ